MPTANDPYIFTGGGTAVASQVNARFSALFSVINQLDSSNIADGSIQAADLASALLTSLGLNAGTGTRRGKVNIPADESTGSTTFTLMPTADRVSQIILPADGYLMVGYRAEVMETVLNAATVGLFLGANQVKLNNGVVQTGLGGPNATNYTTLSSHGGGLSAGGNFGTTYAGDDLVNGQLVAAVGGGFALIEANAGTYDVSIQYKASSGVVHARNRRLRAMALAFS